jgi:PAS domain S-box-containing protein
MVDLEEYRRIVEGAPDAIIVAGRDGTIRIWNSAAERIFGHAAAEVAGQSLDVIIPERLRDAHWKGYDASLASGTTKYSGQVLTTRSVHKDGRKIYVDLSFALLKDTAGDVTGVMAMARDVTARHLASRATPP